MIRVLTTSQAGLRRAVLAALFLTGSGAGAAQADDQPFLTLDATDIEPQFGHELEQDFGWSHGKTHQAFDEFEGESELEYGWSDQVQVAVSTSYAWTREHDNVFPAGPAQSGSEWGGVSGELIYQALNVYFDPIGLGVLVSPSVGPDWRGIEAKLLVQKNFINDRLRFVVNAGGEFGAEKDDGAWNDTSALTFDAGLAYNFTWEWSAGLEFNAEHDFDGLLLDGRAMPVASTYYFGPTIQYIAHPWTASLGLQAQLPWANDPTRTAGALDHGFLADAERLRVALRVTRDLY